MEKAKKERFYKLKTVYEQAVIELADFFLENYFDCQTCYTDPSSTARFVADDIGGVLDCGSDIAFFNMQDILEILEIRPEKDVPYTYMCKMLDRGEGKWERFQFWYFKEYIQKQDN
jgi:hypothetical protein